MLSQERFNEIESEYDCGYWFECCDRACPCAITTENKGLRQDIWDNFKKEQEKLIEDFDNNTYYDCIAECRARCRECGCIESENALTDGLCYSCYDNLNSDSENLDIDIDTNYIDFEDNVN